MNKDIAIVGGARTAMCEYSGTPGYGKFKGVSALIWGLTQRRRRWNERRSILRRSNT